MKIWEGRSYLVGRYMLPYFFVTCKTKIESISTTSLTKNSSFEKSAINLVVSNREKLSIHQTHFHPKFDMFPNSLTTFINIFNFFFIKIQKTTLQNIPNRRFRVYPLSRFRFRNHEIISTRNRNQLTIKKGNTYISYKRQHSVMCTWNTNRSRTQQNLMSKAQQLQETIDSNVCMKH